MRADTTVTLSEPGAFATVNWSEIPDEPGVDVIADQREIVCVGMAGRNGNGTITSLLRDQSKGF